ncbi:hypothetical protein BKA70DRAFT_1309499 [Coprinopsis sp. MPI-PUGE-AT-0042]|nr:hypothetical protein BKA70DRAFT_1309499 [Coprinopsis sp. MPI-PUGE-AT-0042]
MGYIPVRNIGSFVSSRTKLKLLHRQRQLITLPEEVLAMFMMELDVQSLVRLRSTCRLLNRVSRSRHIWRNIFLLGLGDTIPRPFFLSKPLQDCSAEDIEADLRRWETGWGSGPREPHIGKREVDSDQENKRSPASLQTLCLIPGGRWLIVGYEDGSVWSLDLSDHDGSSGKICRKLLVPSPFESTEHSETRLQVKLSVDFSSDEALGDSQKTYHIQQFNIAVMVCPMKYKLASTHIDVWRVHVSNGSDRWGLRLGEHLSSFTEIGTAALQDCSLLGSALAYSLGTAPATCVVIVRWPAANGKPKDKVNRHYLPGLALDKAILLPGDRLFGINGRRVAYVYDWAKNFPTSTLQPHEQLFPRVTPSLRHEAPMRNVHGISPPMVLHNTTRILVQGTSSVSGFQIPVEGDSKKAAVTCLVKGRFGFGQAQAYGYHRGVGFSNHDLLTSSEYRWPGETASPEAQNAGCRYHTVNRLDNFDGGRMLLDQYSNRAVVVDFYASQLFFVSFGD